MDHTDKDLSPDQRAAASRRGGRRVVLQEECFINLGELLFGGAKEELGGDRGHDAMVAERMIADGLAQLGGHKSRVARVVGEMLEVSSNLITHLEGLHRISPEIYVPTIDPEIVAAASRSMPLTRNGKRRGRVE